MPIDRLTQKVAQFKQAHHGQENVLMRILAKFDLDKFILLKERLTCMWNEKLYNRLGDLNIKQDLQKLKALRQVTYLKQLKAYDSLLQQLKLRSCVPAAEEKMLLDGLKLVLDNGWTVGTQEIEQLMQMCHLDQHQIKDPEFKQFFDCLVDNFGE